MTHPLMLEFLSQLTLLNEDYLQYIEELVITRHLKTNFPKRVSVNEVLIIIIYNAKAAFSSRRFGVLFSIFLPCGSELYSISGKQVSGAALEDCVEASSGTNVTTWARIACVTLYIV